jgi:Uma2 family endonuclease
MAIEIRTEIPRPWRVATYVPNERETQILGGTQAHYTVGMDLAQTLMTRAERLGVVWLVRADTDLLYPRVDDSTGVFFPDVFVAPGVEIDDQEPYDVRKVGKPPALVIEILSQRTARKDVGIKLQAYAEMGVEEYVTFDPRPRKQMALHGYRLVGQGRYVEIPPAPEGGLWLATVGLRIVAEAPRQPMRGPRLRLFTADGTPLLHAEEEAAAHDAAEAAWHAERVGREVAEHAREAERRAREAAEHAREAAEVERDNQAAEIARLRALLADAGGGNHSDPTDPSDPSDRTDARED